jgi:hypothetical protein
MPCGPIPYISYTCCCFRLPMSVAHHRQNPIESTINSNLFCLCNITARTYRKHRSSVAVYGTLPSSDRCIFAYFAAVAYNGLHAAILLK